MTTKGALTITSIATAMLFGGGIFLYMNFGSIAKQLTQDYASRTLGVEVSIGRMDISLQNRKIDVGNVKIGNPEAYEGAHSVVVQSISIQAGEIGRELLEFKDVAVQGADIYLEIRPEGTNLSDIRKNLNPRVGDGLSSGEQAIKVILDNLLMSGTVHTDITFLDQEIEPFSLPPIALSGIGRENGASGVAVGDAIAQVWSEISRRTISEANQKGYLAGLPAEVLLDAGMGHIDIVKEKFDSDLNKVKEGLKNLFE